MNKDFLRGVNFSLGIIFVFSIFSIVYAVGFHSAEEIFGGNFSGNFSFNDEVKFKGKVNFSSAQVKGLKTQGALNFVEFNETGIHNFSIPENVEIVYVTLIGSGGGGGGGRYNTWKGYTAHGGLGGYGGLADNVPIFIDNQRNFSVIIGSGGTGGAGLKSTGCAAASPGTSGDPTIFKIKEGSTLVQATGGSGGLGGSGGDGTCSATTGASGASGNPSPIVYNGVYGDRGLRGLANSDISLSTGGTGGTGYARISWYS